MAKNKQTVKALNSEPTIEKMSGSYRCKFLTSCRTLMRSAFVFSKSSTKCVCLSCEAGIDRGEGNKTEWISK